MRASSTALMLAFLLVLSGCASTIQSQVTAFHEWPAEVRDKSFVFGENKEQDNQLEYRTYRNLVRNELLRLGFTENPLGRTPNLKVSFTYDLKSRDVRVMQSVAVDPFYASPFYGAPFYGSPWHRYGYYGPFYDPFWYGPPRIEQYETQFVLYTRQLKVEIARISDAKKLYETTVISEGRNGSLAAVMPYMVHSAFADFPGKSGVPRIVQLKIEE